MVCIWVIGNIRDTKKMPPKGCPTGHIVSDLARSDDFLAMRIQ